MDDRVDLVLADDLSHQVLIAGVADNKRYALRDGPVKARRQIVKYNWEFAGIVQFMDHVAADIASAMRFNYGMDCLDTDSLFVGWKPTRGNSYPVSQERPILLFC